MLLVFFFITITITISRFVFFLNDLNLVLFEFTRCAFWSYFNTDLGTLAIFVREEIKNQTKILLQILALRCILLFYLLYFVWLQCFCSRKKEPFIRSTLTYYMRWFPGLVSYRTVKYSDIEARNTQEQTNYPMKKTH